MANIGDIIKELDFSNELIESFTDMLEETTLSQKTETIGKWLEENVKGDIPVDNYSNLENTLVECVKENKFKLIAEEEFKKLQEENTDAEIKKVAEYHAKLMDDMDSKKALETTARKFKITVKAVQDILADKRAKKYEYKESVDTELEEGRFSKLSSIKSDILVKHNKEEIKNNVDVIVLKGKDKGLVSKVVNFDLRKGTVEIESNGSPVYLTFKDVAVMGVNYESTEQVEENIEDINNDTEDNKNKISEDRMNKLMVEGFNTGVEDFKNKTIKEEIDVIKESGEDFWKGYSDAINESEIELKEAKENTSSYDVMKSVNVIAEAINLLNEKLDILSEKFGKKGDEEEKKDDEEDDEDEDDKKKEKKESVDIDLSPIEEAVAELEKEGLTEEAYVEKFNIILESMLEGVEDKEEAIVKISEYHNSLVEDEKYKIILDEKKEDEEEEDDKDDEESDDKKKEKKVKEEREEITNKLVEGLTDVDKDRVNESISALEEKDIKDNADYETKVSKIVEEFKSEELEEKEKIGSGSIDKMRSAGLMR